jgi:hypothetical protein
VSPDEYDRLSAELAQKLSMIRLAFGEGDLKMMVMFLYENRLALSDQSLALVHRTICWCMNEGSKDEQAGSIR